MSKRARRFRAIIDDAAVELVFADGHVTVDGGEAPVSMERLSDEWYHLILGGRSHSVHVADADNGQFRVTVDGLSTDVTIKDEREMLLDRFRTSGNRGASVKEVRAPMPGLVLETLVGPGDVVRKGDGLVVLEAMKMENVIKSATEGAIEKVLVVAGDTVTKSELLVTLL